MIAMQREIFLDLEISFNRQNSNYPQHLDRHDQASFRFRAHSMCGVWNPAQLIRSQRSVYNLWDCSIPSPIALPVHNELRHARKQKGHLR